MPEAVRQCTKCGQQDPERTWPSMDAAASAGALGASWSCPSCGWPESELADLAPSGSTPAAPLAAPLDPNLAELPDDPDERRRAVETTLPMDHP